MATENDQTYCQRGREDQANRTPKPRPERSRCDNRYRRKPCTTAIYEGLDNLSCNDLDYQEESGRSEDHRPARSDRRREYERKYSGNHRSYVRHETQYHREHAPQWGAWNADKRQTNSDDEA